MVAGAAVLGAERWAGCGWRHEWSPERPSTAPESAVLSPVRRACMRLGAVVAYARRWARLSPMTDLDFTGRTAVVVGGGGGGIGTAMVEALARRGADIGAVTIDADHAADTRQRVEALGRRVDVRVADVTEPGALAEALADDRRRPRPRRSSRQRRRRCRCRRLVARPRRPARCVRPHRRPQRPLRHDQLPVVRQPGDRGRAHAAPSSTSVRWRPARSRCSLPTGRPRRRSRRWDAPWRPSGGRSVSASTPLRPAP